MATFDRELTAMPGVADAIHSLSPPVCVASSSDPVRLRHSLTLTGLLPLFSGHVSRRPRSAGQAVPRSVPVRCRTNEHAADACLVIEDSVPGVTAAKAAGMRVAGFTGGGHWTHDRSGQDLLQAGAATIFSDFSNLSKVIID